MNNNLKKYMDELDKERARISSLITSVTKQYVNENSIVEFNRMSVDERTSFNYYINLMKSNAFKIKCLYEIFPQLLEDNCVLHLPYRENETFMIHPQLVDIGANPKVYFDEIADERIIFKNNEISQTEYKQTFYKTLNKMIESGKITPQMIDECKNIGKEEEKNLDEFRVAKKH